MHITVIYSHMGPYHWARARATAERTRDCTFLEICSSQQKYPWKGAELSSKVNHVCLFDKAIETLSPKELNISITAALDRLNPKVIFIPGYSPSYLLKAARWAVKHGAASVLCCDSWELDRRRFWIKEFTKKLAIRRLYKAAFVAGERSAAYVNKLGIPQGMIWRGVDVVDNEYFEAGSKAARANPYLKKTLGLPEEYILCVARYLPRKNIPVLIKAFGQFRQSGGKDELVLVGDGPIRSELEELIADLGLRESVHLFPWASYGDLSSYYAFARYLVLPSSSEPWGLVVNEAMAAGLPVLVSGRCGCVPELCRMGINGFVFNHDDAHCLARLMVKMSDGSVDLQSMSQASRQIVSSWSVDAWARSVIDCASAVAP